MLVRTHSILAAAAGLWLALPLLGQEPARLEVERGQALMPLSKVPANQSVANTIADHLRQSGQLHHYAVDVVYHDGVAELSGTVADQPQREEVLRIAQGIPGVERVLDRLNLGGADTVRPAQAIAPTGPMETTPMPQRAPEDPSAGFGQDPVPMYQGPMPGSYDVNPPRMPPYAWPTYAPYNNYSRVAYPEAYPYQAWPFIGPCYPFPMVPLGWRAVKLEWQDGHWWFSKTATQHDWWRLRYW